MCDCVNIINGKLDGVRLNTAISVDFKSERPVITLIRKDTFKPETRRGRAGVFRASFCPFCGEKYADAE